MRRRRSDRGREVAKRKSHLDQYRQGKTPAVFVGLGKAILPGIVIFLLALTVLVATRPQKQPPRKAQPHAVQTQRLMPPKLTKEPLEDVEEMKGEIVDYGLPAP